MSEKILYQHQIQDLTEAEGFDAPFTGVPAPGPRTGQPALGGTIPDPNPISSATVTSDIAAFASNVPLVQNAISVSLPFMIGYTQPLATSEAFALGLQQKSKLTLPAGQLPNDDISVIRKFVKTEVREVTLDLTNETAEDIVNLFGDSFSEKYDKFIKSGGELWDGPNGPLAKFFLSLAKQRMTSKINKDFIAWIETVAFNVGNAAFGNSNDLRDIIIALSEMRETLFKRTNKDGGLWLLTTPKVANFLATFYNRQHDSADMYREGKRRLTSEEHGYVTTIGDIDVYQSEFIGTEKAFMGYKGSPGTSSIFYYPYKEYIIQAGEDYYTGQSNVYYRVRDTWSTNPLDTYNNTVTPGAELEKGNIPANNSNFVVSATLNINFKILN